MTFRTVIPEFGEDMAERAVDAPLSGNELVREFLRATECLPSMESAAVAGVSEATYNRWCRQPPRTLRASQRVRIERYLGMGPNAEPEIWLG
jgi:hypothetical protein